MPRLGGDVAPLRRRQPVSSYVNKLPRPNLRNIFLALATFFILRNLLRNDYRKEEYSYLRTGFSPEEIEKIIPMTEEERMKYLHERGNDVEGMKKGLAYLMNEVQVARGMGKEGDLHPPAERDAMLKEMDSLHLLKRKQHEEQLLKEHPDFVPSKRLPRPGGGNEGEAKIV